MIAILVTYTAITPTNVILRDWIMYAVALGYGIAALVVIGAVWLWVLHQADPYVTRWLHRRHGRQAVQREQSGIEAERRAASTGARR